MKHKSSTDVCTHQMSNTLLLYCLWESISVVGTESLDMRGYVSSAIWGHCVMRSM